MPARVAIIPTSHLDLFWLGDYRNCLRRGDDLIRQYLDRCRENSDETFVIDTVIFAQHFVENNPDYVPLVRQLLDEGRLEIGAAYIDHRENVVLGESLIRNIQIGRRWLRDTLGVDGRMAAHPDLPGIHAQTPQIYSKAGMKYYVTSRKIFQNGRVWRHRAPDGSALTMLTWPMHYSFVPVRASDIPETEDENWVAGRSLDLEGLPERYPFGTVAIAGSAGDLTDPVDFVRRYGRDLREYVEMYREQYPDTTWEFSIPAKVVKPYLEHPETALSEVEGSVPCVWGIGSLEPMSLLHAVRRNEALLLAAEVASVVAVTSGRPALPESARAWQGLFSEDAFFARGDLPPQGRELEWLWRMHAFTQDHNGGGQDGTLSTFQKKVRQDRIRLYAGEVIEHATGRAGQGAVGVLRTRLGSSDPLLIVDGGDVAAVRDLDATGDSTQAVQGADGLLRLAVASRPLEGVGLAPLALAGLGAGAATVLVDDNAVTVSNELLTLSVDVHTGAATVVDRLRGHTWQGINADLSAVPELATSATLRVNEEALSTCRESEVSVVAVGPLATQVKVERTFLGVLWTSILTAWNDMPRVDVDHAVQWPGLTMQQLRLGLIADAPRDTIHFGTAFHGTRWDEVPEGSNAGWASDEVTPEVWASYREAEHWLHVASGDAGVTIATGHPAFFHDGENLKAVLFRTAASGGDYRFHFTNAGLTTWHFEIVLGDSAWTGAPELGDRAWRKPIVVVGATQEATDALRSEGDEVMLSALMNESDGSIVARLVNQSDQERTVALTGTAVRDHAAVIDLDDNLVRLLPVEDHRVRTAVGPWEIQTIRLGGRE